jgi:glycosyltransferase involved in cell wall biosynthesis
MNRPGRARPCRRGWKDRSLKILHVISSISEKHGGPSKACVEMANALAARGHHVDIFTTDQDGVDARLNVPLGVPVRTGLVDITYFKADLLGVWPAASFGLAAALRDRLREYDLVETHALYLAHGLAVGHYARRYGVPYVVRPCGVLDPFVFRRGRPKKAIAEFLFESRNLMRAAGVHFTADEEMSLAKSVINIGHGFVVPLGLNTEEYDRPHDPGLVVQTYPELKGKRIVLFLSRINFKKGLDILVPAFAKAARERPDVHLVLAGPDNEGFADKVRGWVSEQGMDGRVTFTGMIRGDLKLAMLREAEMFVLSSYSENFGISVVEAMAAGLPVVISDKINIHTEVANARAGLVCDTDPDQVGDAIAKLLDDGVLRAQMSANGKQLVATAYSWAGVAEQLEQVYRGFIDRSAGTTAEAAE